MILNQIEFLWTSVTMKNVVRFFIESWPIASFLLRITGSAASLVAVLQVTATPENMSDTVLSAVTVRADGWSGVVA